MVDAIKEITGVDFWKDMTFEEAKLSLLRRKSLLKNTTLKLATLSTPSLKSLLKKL